MPNSNNALPASGRLSLQDIADAFYLYKAYADGNPVAIDDYYGDLIRYYSPTTPAIPTSITKRINVDVFHGKRYGLPIPLTINSPVYNYNVFDQAETYAQNTYGLKLNTPGVPFFITVTNNSSVGSTAITAPGVNTNTANYTTPGSHTWTVPAGVTAVNIIVVGGGGGGGGGSTDSQYPGGGGGGGGQVYSANNISVTPGSGISIVVGAGGALGATNTAGVSGASSSFNSTLSAVGGGGGLAGGSTTKGVGGPAGGAGGSKGGTSIAKGADIITGGSGGRTLAAPYGVGGTGGGYGSFGTIGGSGAVLITFATTSSNTRNTQNTAAMVVGTSSDGSKVLNSYTSVEIINNGSITGATDPTPYRSYSGSGTITVNEGENSIEFDLAGPGGGGGIAGSIDRRQTSGGSGGPGGRIQGSLPVRDGDVVGFDVASITLNGQTMAYATGGGYGGFGNGQQGPSGSWGGIGSGSASGGSGGYGESPHDGRAGFGPGQGSPGWANVSYQPGLPGGPALYLTASTSVTNNGVVAGGSSSNGVVGSGYAVIGRDKIVGTIGGTVYGSLV
jgi:hypothetical protein